MLNINIEGKLNLDFIDLTASIVRGVFVAVANVTSMVVVGLCGFPLVLFFVSTFDIFLFWLCTFPFLQTVAIPLGEGIPDLSLDKVVFIALFTKWLISLLRKRLYLLKPKTEDILLLGFLIWVVFSTLFLHRQNVLKQMLALWNQFFFPLGMYWAVKHIVTRKADFEKILIACTVLFLILALPAIPEYVSQVTPLGKPAQIIDGTVRVRSFLSSPWVFGDTSLMLLPITLFPWVTRSYARWKMFNAFTFFLGLVGILLSFMRGTWLAAAVVLSILPLSLPRFRKYLYLSAPFFVLLVVFTMPIVMNSTVLEKRIENAQNVDLRLNVLKEQINLIVQKPITGHGLKSVFEEYLARTDYYDWGSYHVRIPSHNTFLSMGVDFGVFALLYYLPIALIFLKSILYSRKFPKNYFLRGIPLLLGLSVLAHLINSATFETRFFIWLNTLPWVLLALMSVTPRIYAQSAFVPSVGKGQEPL